MKRTTTPDTPEAFRAVDIVESNAVENEAPFPLNRIVSGLVLVGLFVGMIAAWTIFAPLHSAVVSPGIVSVAGHRKQVQHFEGGIVEKILAEDGDYVEKGQLLIKLRDLHPAAELNRLERRHLEAQAAIARLSSERKGDEQVAHPEELLVRKAEPAVLAAMAGQENVFLARRNLFRDKQSVLEHKISQKQEEVTGLGGRIEAAERERALLQEELETVQQALKDNLLPKAKGLELQQRLAQRDGDLIRFHAEIDRLRQSILEIRVQMSEAQAQRLSDITGELRTQGAMLYELSQKILSARDVLHRTEILSPTEGIVVNLQVHSADGVITAGQPLLEVVPTASELVVYAYIDPEDIEEVRVGMPVDVRLTSFSRRRRIPLEGTVSTLSADRIYDSQSQTEYYHARIELKQDTEALAQAELVAGMGADVFILTGSRTPLDYLLSPITKIVEKGFKEQ